MATHSSTLAWKIPWEEPGRLQSMGVTKESDTTERLHFHFSSILLFSQLQAHPFSSLKNPPQTGSSSGPDRIQIIPRLTFRAQTDRSLALMSLDGLGIPWQTGLFPRAKITVLLPSFACRKVPWTSTLAWWHTLPFPAFLCSPESHLPGLKRVVDVKSSIVRAGSMLDHSWVLWADICGSVGTWCLCGNS